MKKYHIIYKVNEKDYYSQGETFDANDEIEALNEFRKKYPEMMFLAMYSNSISLLLEHSQEEQ